MPPILAYLSGGFQYITPDLVFPIKTVIIIAIIIADEGAIGSGAFIQPMKRSRTNSVFLKPVLLVLAFAATGPRAIDAQENRSSTVRLFRLDGSFSADLPVKIDSEAKSQEIGFSLLSARLEADQMSFLTRVRSVLTVANRDANQRIIEMEWRLDIYDEALRTLSQRVLQSDKVKIYPGETASASANFGAVLPDRMVILFQLVRVSFADGPAWSSPRLCSLGGDLRTISCKSREN